MREPHATLPRFVVLAGCLAFTVAPTVVGESGRLVSDLSKAYLEGDTIGVQTYSDPDRLAAREDTREIMNVAAVRPCGMWGNDRLAIASVNAAYEGHATLGHARVLLVLRKPAHQWQLLVAARDPVSNNQFVKEAPRLTALLTSAAQSRPLPIPATLLAPATGNFPRPQKWRALRKFPLAVEPV